MISGYCEIGERCFIGVNATFADKLSVGKDGLIGAGAVVTKSTDPEGVYLGNPAKKREGTPSGKSIILFTDNLVRS